MRIYKIHIANQHDPKDTSGTSYSFNVAANTLSTAVTEAEIRVPYPNYIDQITVLAGDDISNLGYINYMDETQKLIDSVMSNLKTLMQAMSDEAVAYEKEWRERIQANTQSRSGFNIWEATEAEEREQERQQRYTDELYDKVVTIRACLERVAGTTNRIIGENIEIQFSKWNMQSIHH